MVARSVHANVRAGAHNRRRRTHMTGALMVSLSLVVSALILSRRPPVEKAEQSVAPVVAEFDTVSLPVPFEPVAAGTRIKDIKFRSVAFPRHQIPPGALVELSAYGDGIVTAALPANIPLFRENISVEGFAANPVVEQIPVGMRAMTIRVDATTAVEGWAGSGSLVDVLLVRDKTTTVIAERVRILSAERSVSPVDGGSAPNIPSTVTLLVTQEQCLAINTAIPLGRIAFALRNGQDSDLWNVRNFDADSLRAGGLGSSAKAPAVNGYIAFSDGEGARRGFTLADGKWIASDVVPRGFLLAGGGDADAAPQG